MITIIAAVELGGGIGNGGKIPWKAPADMKRFQALTLGHPVIMGRKTWDSIPPRFRPLKDRSNIVVSRSAGPIDGCFVVPSLEMAVILAKKASGENGDVFVIGGAEVYAQTLASADQMLMTIVHEAHSCDISFPNDLGRDWAITHEGYVAPEDGQPGLTFLKLETFLKHDPASSGRTTVRHLRGAINFARYQLAASSP